MPVLDTLHLADLAARSVNATNATAEHQTFDVVCAWPVSGQYGPGSRILYYVLVAICVLARRADWLRNACLAAALLLPLIAALHGIVLATVHIDNAVDLDIYGAFQCCAIGVLVAPVAATLSRTYFKNPGRNAIVVWSLIVIAGLISLTVEFYRVSGQPVPCSHDDFGRLLDPNEAFPSERASCGLTCNTDDGPFSPIRGGSADNIYVVAVPYILTFNVCILLTAACCIPAILLIAWMIVSSTHTNWTRRFGEQSSHALKVPVKLFDEANCMPSPRELRRRMPNLTKIGVIGTQAFNIRQRSRACAANGHVEENQTEHNEVVASSSTSSTGAAPSKAGLAGVLHDLHEESALSVYDFELNGRPLQIREMKLAANVDSFARQVYEALRDLENEEVDIICVESIEVEENTAEAKVIDWLRNEEKAQREANGKKSGRETSLTPGAIILLGLFGMAVLAILAIGERNLFSQPVDYQTEPMANVGQWAPVAGTILVVAGSIYVLIAEAMRKERRRKRAEGDSIRHDRSSLLERTTGTFIRRLIQIHDKFDAPRWLFDHAEFEDAQKKWVEVPGEPMRNVNYTQTKQEYEPKDSGASIRSATPSRRSTSAESPGGMDRERSPSDPEVAPPARARTLTLPRVEPPRPAPRRATNDGPPPAAPMDSIAPRDSNPIIVVTDDQSGDEGKHDDVR